MEQPEKHILILGTRGVPAAHGGFETFAERYALYLVERGWRVSVYCQEDGAAARARDRRLARRHPHLHPDGARGRARHARFRLEVRARRAAAAGRLSGARLQRRGVPAGVCGRSAARCSPTWTASSGSGRNGRSPFAPGSTSTNGSPPGLRSASSPITPRSPTIWRRAGRAATSWSSPTAAIPCGPRPTAPVRALGLTPGRYLISIARIEPDNNIAAMVGRSRPAARMKLVVLGNLEDDNAYHAEVRAAASEDVVFPGGDLRPATVRALRFHAAPICMATSSAAPIPRWSKRCGPATR